MTGFHPGDGWREVTRTEHDERTDGGDTVVFHRNGGHRYWVRREPVPPLPTAPYTVIRATWLPGGNGAVKETYVLAYLGRWCNVNTGVRHEPPELQAGITGFEVLALPVSKLLAEDEGERFDRDDLDDARRDGAKAALDMVKRSRIGDYPSDGLLDMVVDTVVRAGR